MNLLHDRIAVKPLDVPYTGKIIIPDSAKPKKTWRGTVVATGPECKEISIGDIVHHMNYNEFKIDGERMFLMFEGDVIAKECN
jgi:co-chaperonin GroES (HSP10)